MEDKDIKILKGVFSQFEVSNKNPYNIENRLFYRVYNRKTKISKILSKLRTYYNI